MKTLSKLFHLGLSALFSAVFLAAPAQADPGPNYQQMDFGTTGCSVTFGPELAGYNIQALVRQATIEGAYGFVYNKQTEISYLITAPFPAGCRPPVPTAQVLYLATGPVFEYELKDYGFNACHVNFGTLMEDVDEGAMVEAARLANAVGFTYKKELRYGKVIQGAYPQGCKSDKSLSWPLYLAKGAEANYVEQSYGFNGCPVKFGPLIRNTNRTAMNIAAKAAGAKGYTFKDSLQYGEVMIGDYPSGCKSSKSLSWPLYLLE